jgi:predicted nucleic acid-binding protein
VIVDTNVLAYALLGPDALHQESRDLLTGAGELWAPRSLRAEYLSVVWQWSRRHGVEVAVAEEVLHDGLAMIDRYVPVADLEDLALTLARQRDHSPYDTLFVALAMREDDVVATHDRALLQRFPEWCAAPAELLG